MSEVRLQFNSSLTKCTSCGEEVTFVYRGRVPTHDPICGDLTCYKCEQEQEHDAWDGYSCVHHPRLSGEQNNDSSRPLATRELRAPALFLQYINRSPNAPVTRKASKACAGAPGGAGSVEEAKAEDGVESKQVEGEATPNPKGVGSRVEGQKSEEPAPAIPCDMCVETLLLLDLPAEKAHPSIVYCAKCTVNMCIKHADSHRSKFGDEHTIVDLQEKVAVTEGLLPLFDKCTVHVGNPLMAVDMNTYKTVCNLCIEAYPMEEYILVNTAGPIIRKALDEMWLLPFKLNTGHESSMTKFVPRFNTSPLEINNNDVTFPKVLQALRGAACELNLLCEEVISVRTLVNRRIKWWRNNRSYHLHQMITQYGGGIDDMFKLVIKTLQSMINTRSALYGTLIHVANYITEGVKVILNTAGIKQLDGLLEKKREEREVNAMSVGKDVYMLKTLSCIKKTLENDDQFYLAKLTGKLVKNKVTGLMEAMYALKAEFIKGDQCSSGKMLNRQLAAQELSCARCIQNILPQLLQVTTKKFWSLSRSYAYDVGDVVEAMWKSHGRYYKAIVVGVSIDGTYFLGYDDGEVDKAVPESSIRPIYYNML